MHRFLLAASAFTLLAAPAIAGEDKYVRLVQTSTGKVLSIADGSDEAAARAVVVKEDAKDKAQEWKMEKDGDFLKITNRKTGKVLDVFEDSKDEGAPIIQYDEKGDDNDNQRWSWVGTGAEKKLKSKSSNLVLDVDGEGKVLQKKAEDAAKGQTWKVVEVK